MGIESSTQRPSRNTSGEMNNPFSTDHRIRKLEIQLSKHEDNEREVVYRIRRYIQGYKAKYYDKTDPIDQIIDLCDGFWKAQDTYSKLAETNRAEWIKCASHAQALGNALNIKDTEIIDVKAALREREEEARTKVREHKDVLRKHDDETRNFLHTISQLNDQINEIKARTEAELRRVRDEHAAALDAAGAQHRYAFEKQQTDHAWAMQTQANGYEQELHRKELECGQRIASLEADLLTNSDDFRPATDDVLKVKYRKLKLLIDTITDPFNLGASGVTHLSERLDPTSFLSREGNKFLRFLLRSVIWGIVMDGFFSMPFGFGALGPDVGRQQLLDVFRAWHRLYSAGNEAVSPYYNQDELEIFQRDKEANKWRSATFQSIMAAVMPKAAGGRQAAPSQVPATAMGTTYAQNCVRVERDILAVLNEVANGVVHGELQDSVPEIARLAGELALEFGAQRSQLGLMLPVRGDNIQIGEQFVDCIDGDGGKGSYVAVELVVCPCMFRVGDGRLDMQSGRTIFPGEIYPMRNQLP